MVEESVDKQVRTMFQKLRMEMEQDFKEKMANSEGMKELIGMLNEVRRHDRDARGKELQRVMGQACPRFFGFAVELHASAGDVTGLVPLWKFNVNPGSTKPISDWLTTLPKILTPDPSSDINPPNIFRHHILQESNGRVSFSTADQLNLEAVGVVLQKIKKYVTFDQLVPDDYLFISNISLAALPITGVPHAPLASFRRNHLYAMDHDD